MKKKYTWLFVSLIVAAALLMGFDEIGRKVHTDTTDTEPRTTQEINDTDGYTYNEVEWEITALAQDDTELMEINKLIDPLNKGTMVDLAHMRGIVSVLGLDEERYLGDYAEKDDAYILSKDEFEIIYAHIVDAGELSSVSRRKVYVYQVMANDEELASPTDAAYVAEEKTLTVLSSGESYEIKESDYSEDYLGENLDCYVKDGEIYKVCGLADEKFCFENVLIISYDEQMLRFFYDGYECELPYSMQFELNIPYYSVADITIYNHEIIGVVSKTAKCTSVLSSVDGEIKTAEECYAYDETFRCYDISGGEVKNELSTAVLVGYDEVSLITEGKNAKACIISGQPWSQEINVIICNTDYTSYNHDSVTFSCESNYTIELPSGIVIAASAQEKQTINSADYTPGEVITVKPSSEHNGLILESVDRAGGHPEYKGYFRIYIYKDYLHIVNTVDLEQYLCSVVSSELSTSGYDEAMKAMAICARGYAYNKIKEGSFADYNADIDDSTVCQVYNARPASEDTIRAVRDTYGLACTYNNEIIIPFYYSTSCGSASTNDQIWGGNTYVYTRANVESLQKNLIDLSSEEAFAGFLEDALGYEPIEKDMPYYRWSIEFTNAMMTETINNNLPARIDVSSDAIQLVTDEADARPFGTSDETDIGDIQSIEVAERSASGVVEKLIITGSKASIEVTGQTNIRNLISPEKADIVRQDGIVVNGWKSLPSPYYLIEKTDSGYIIRGGGLGHGVGMSQNGARILAQNGYDYKFILNHYFTYIDISVVYDIHNQD